MRVDAVVNATDSALSGDGGVDRAVQRAGGPAIRAACDTLRATTLPDGLSVGAAVVTPAGNLPASWVVHTVGPRHSASEDRAGTLRATYTRSLAAAEAVGARTIAFPLISGGAGGWPIDDAVREAVAALTDADSAMEVTLVAADPGTAALMRRELA
ncbi:MAG: macro domain-containing protein [Rhodococcus sp. (in: high G+C Gram-positive bacteria)]|uniref:macro domain-containing protein n=1 Tax=Rhodococcus sp. TaxID=1831 RepID=UPI003BB68FE8